MAPSLGFVTRPGKTRRKQNQAVKVFFARLVLLQFKLSAEQQRFRLPHIRLLRQQRLLTNRTPVRIIYVTSLLFGAGLGFHAEWLRDEP